jgi:hypothetical protein
LAPDVIRARRRADAAARAGRRARHRLERAGLEPAPSAHGSPGERIYPPRRLGAYGHRDEHPLAATRTESTVAYLAERMHELASRVPGAREWFVSYRMLDQMLGDGFDPVAWLSACGIETNCWTLDRTDSDADAVLERMLAAGVARITTNTTEAWRHALSVQEPAT